MDHELGAAVFHVRQGEDIFQHQFRGKNHIFPGIFLEDSRFPYSEKTFAFDEILSSRFNFDETVLQCNALNRFCP